MKRTKVLGLALVAAFAMSALASASALAAPEFIRESGTLKGTTFTDSSGVSELEIESPKQTITCTASTSTGTIESSTTALKNVIKYTGCTTLAKSVKCHSTLPEATNEEEIITDSLKATLTGTEAKPEEELGPESGTEFTKIKCGTLSGVVTGVVKGTVSPVNTFASEGKLTFAKAEGLKFANSKSLLTTADTIKYPTGVKIKVT